MAPDTPAPLDTDGLTPVEHLRTVIRLTLRERFPDLPDDDIRAHTLAIANAIPGHWLPARPVSLTYAWSDGHIYSTVDRGGIPDDTRERALLRALLVHTLQRLEAADILPPGMQPVVAP